MLGGFQELEVDFVADNPRLTRFHCHQQLHMDFGFMVSLLATMRGSVNGCAKSH
jgi:FtsP/CotA-like multicopper oxidase with cupredoxin domain